MILKFDGCIVKIPPFDVTEVLTPTDESHIAPLYLTNTNGCTYGAVAQHLICRKNTF
jgi:hypothetical protein